MSENSNAKITGAPKPTQQDIDIAIIQREIEKLQTGIERRKNVKKIVLFVAICTILGSFSGFLKVQTESYDIDSYYFQMRDSLESHSILNEFERNEYGLTLMGFELRLDTSRTYSSADTSFIKDSLNNVKSRIENRINHNLEVEKSYRYWSTPFYGALIGFLIGVCFHFFATTVSNFVDRIRIFQLKQELSAKGAEKLKDSISDDFFNKIIEINFKYLDQYYMQTQQQAYKSFSMCVGAAIVGFAVIIVGLVMMFVNPDKVQLAYVTTGAGIISEFIAAVFFYLYNRTVVKMSQYHQKLVITQNISLALKTADELKGSQEKREKSLEIIIDRLTQDVNKHLTDSRE